MSPPCHCGQFERITTFRFNITGIEMANRNQNVVLFANSVMATNPAWILSLSFNTLNREIIKVQPQYLGFAFLAQLCLSKAVANQQYIVAYYYSCGVITCLGEYVLWLEEMLHAAPTIQHGHIIIYIGIRVHPIFMLTPNDHKPPIR